jgi:hypothetical protein
MPPHVTTKVFKETNFVQAKALTPQYQDTLERIERRIRNEIAQDPALKPVYEVLRRQLQLLEGHAMDLYSKLASERAETDCKDAPAPASEEADDKTEKDEATKKAKSAVASPAPPSPHIDAPSAPHATPSSLLPPRQAPPSDPLRPFPPPSEALSGVKRPHGFGEPKEAKRLPFVPCVDDWKCGSCDNWNMRWMIRCGGKDGECGVKREDSPFKHVFQKEGPGIDKRISRAKLYGDWLCSCGWWNHVFKKECGQLECGNSEECKVGQDFNQDLEAVYESYSVLTNGYDYEIHPEAQNASSASRRQRYEYAASRGFLKAGKKP